MIPDGDRKLSCKVEGGKVICIAADKDSICNITIDIQTGRVIKDYRGKKGEALCKIAEGEALKLFNLSEEVIRKRVPPVQQSEL